MKVLRARNVNDALPLGLILLNEVGERRDSRNGGVMVSPEPVTTVYDRPTERVLFDPLRDANPFFHLFESLWMLAGRNDLAYVEQFAKNMRSYSDDGETMWGAYGWRWRSFFDIDQLAWAIHRLKNDHTDRRVVVQMWAAGPDNAVADAGGKDVPCNIGIHFQVNTKGQLDMTVFNRSNDIVWGAYGANAVHMSIVQEYVASALGRPVGRYWQVSDNYHAYEALYEKLSDGFTETPERCPYGMEDVSVFPLMPNGKQAAFDQDLQMFLEQPAAVGLNTPFFRKIAKPMYLAHRAFKTGVGEEKYLTALEILDQMPRENDWRRACEEWITRRLERFRKAQDDGPDYE